MNLVCIYSKNSGLRDSPHDYCRELIAGWETLFAFKIQIDYFIFPRYFVFWFTSIHFLNYRLTRGRFCQKYRFYRKFPFSFFFGAIMPIFHKTNMVRMVFHFVLKISCGDFNLRRLTSHWTRNHVATSQTRRSTIQISERLARGKVCLWLCSFYHSAIRICKMFNIGKFSTYKVWGKKNVKNLFDHFGMYIYPNFKQFTS